VVDTGADGTHHDFDNLIEFCNASATGTIGLVLCTEDRERPSTTTGTAPTSPARWPAPVRPAAARRPALHDRDGARRQDPQLRRQRRRVAAQHRHPRRLRRPDHQEGAGENDIVAINNSFGGSIGSDYNPTTRRRSPTRRPTRPGCCRSSAPATPVPRTTPSGVQCLSPYVLCVGASTKTDGITAFSSVGRPAAPHPDVARGRRGPATTPRTPRRLTRRGRRRGRRVRQPRPSPRPRLRHRRLPPRHRRARRGHQRDERQRPGCRMGMPEPTGCYEELQGTSMSAPHVTGAAGLVDRGLPRRPRPHPSADELLDILERSAHPAGPLGGAAGRRSPRRARRDRPRAGLRRRRAERAGLDRPSARPPRTTWRASTPVATR
jgi:hypothetical protein